MNGSINEVTSLPADWLRPLGETGLTVSALCAGGAPLGSMPENFGYEVSAQRGIDTAARVIAGPITFLDTANGYSSGESERRIGTAIERAGGLPEGFVLATKVDRGADGDYSGARVRRSLEESLNRLGLDRVELLYLHDPEHISFAEGTAPGGPLSELVRIRDEGLAAHLGVAGGPVELMRQYLATDEFEAVITHNRYTLVDRSADDLISEANQRGVAVVNAAVYGGGILARGAGATQDYAYQPAAAQTLAAVQEIEQACRRYGVPLAAAALQFSTADPRIAATIVGFSHPERVEEVVQHACMDIPDDLWAQLATLVPGRNVWLF
jgi:D-threo-aldose 1-dehydrogenase